jgi:hypothetical protein
MSIFDQPGPAGAIGGVGPSATRQATVAADAAARWNGHCRRQTSSNPLCRWTSQPKVIAVPYAARAVAFGISD